MVYYDTNVLTNQMFYGVVGNWVVNKIKSSPYIPFINAHTKGLNRAVAIGVAGISAIGIDYTYTYSQEGLLTFTLSGLTFWAIFEHVKQFIVAYIAQQIPYHVMKPTDATATATAITTRAGVSITAASAEPPSQKEK